MSEQQQCRKSLPAAYFYDPHHYELELQAIWQQEWICLGRTDEWQRVGDYRLVRIGHEQILVTRAADGVLRAFHNTCRHRGSVLCEAERGHFDRGRIVCPYHAWVYSLEGKLERTPWRMESPDFKPQDMSLYGVRLETWRGFVFINLAQESGHSLQQAVAGECGALDNWPLEQLKRVHRENHQLACNWKLFWENFLECYHCPGVHPELCSLVPAYRNGMMSDGSRTDGLAPSEPQSELRPGAVTWSADGHSPLPWFEGLSEQEQARGMTFATVLPTMFMVAHVDYLRTVRVMPRGPEHTELIVDWMLHPQAADQPGLDIERLVEFGSMVVKQDARVCELNQQGIHCSRHEHGILMPQESDVHAFEQWVRQKLA